MQKNPTLSKARNPEVARALRHVLLLQGCTHRPQWMQQLAVLSRQLEPYSEASATRRPLKGPWRSGHERQQTWKEIRTDRRKVTVIHKTRRRTAQHSTAHDSTRKGRGTQENKEDKETQNQTKHIKKQRNTQHNTAQHTPAHRGVTHFSLILLLSHVALKKTPQQKERP